MGRRGPAPTPTGILEMRGSRRAKQRKDEPRPEVKAPRAPAWLDTLARREWRRVTEELVELNVISELDRGVLAAYCQAASDVERLTRKLREKEEGDVVRSVMGGLIKNPLHQLLKEAYDRMLVHGRELGLTPAARTRVKVAPPAPSKPGDLRSFVADRRRPA